jgi:hypothetical protein
MSHVPDINLLRYRHLKGIADKFESAGDNLGSQYAEDANKAYALASKYRKLAQELRA